MESHMESIEENRGHLYASLVVSSYGTAIYESDTNNIIIERLLSEQPILESNSHLRSAMNQKYIRGCTRIVIVKEYLEVQYIYLPRRA